MEGGVVWRVSMSRTNSCNNNKPIITFHCSQNKFSSEAISKLELDAAKMQTGTFYFYFFLETVFVLPISFCEDRKLRRSGKLLGMHLVYLGRKFVSLKVGSQVR